MLWAKWQEGTATWRTNDRDCSDLSTTSLKEALGDLYYWRTFAFPYLYRAVDTTVISISGKLLGFQEHMMQKKAALQEERTETASFTQSWEKANDPMGSNQILRMGFWKNGE